MLTMADLRVVQVVDYQGNYAYARGSVSAVINLNQVVSAVLLRNTRNAFDDITRLHFVDGEHMDVFGKPEDFIHADTSR